MSAIMIICAAILAAWLVYAVLPTCYYKYLRPWHGPQGHGVCLSFDDGPDPLYTPQLLELLERQQVPAVFVVLAERAAEYPQLTQQLVEQGHLPALHGCDHANPLWLGPRASCRQVRQGLQTLAELGIRPCCYRPPHGCLNLALLWELRRQQLPLLLWSSLIGDWQLADVDTLVARLLAAGEPGAVICLHDCGASSDGEPGAPQGTIDALAKYLPWAKRQGISFTVPDFAQEEEEEGQPWNAKSISSV